MKRAKVGVVTLGHYVYFEQFEGLREELMKKGEQFISLIEPLDCEIINAGYVDKVDDAFVAVQRKRTLIFSS